jgi:hypothetical protein
VRSLLCRELPREIIISGWSAPRLGSIWLEETTREAYRNFTVEFGVEGISGKTLVELARGGR